MVNKIKSFDRDDDLEYWFKINLDTANNEMVKMSKETIYSRHTNKWNALTHQMLDLITGHYDEYEIKMKEHSFNDKKEFIGMRIISFGAILGFYEEVIKKMTSLSEKNNLDLTEKIDKLNYEMIHCKSRLYGSIKFALNNDIPKEVIKEWYSDFIDNELLYIGLPIDSVLATHEQLENLVESYHEIEYILENNSLEKQVKSNLQTHFKIFKRQENLEKEKIIF